MEASPINKKNVIQPVFNTINSLVEFYMKCVIKPAVVFHEIFYSWLNVTIWNCLDASSDYIPEWFTANFITYARTLFVIPCLFLLAHGYHVLPSIIVISVDFGDFLDGVVARYWVDRRKARGTDKESCIKDEKEFDKSTTSQFLKSWSLDHRDRTYGGFIDAICDKVFIAPCWIILLSTVQSSGFTKMFHFLTLMTLICTETASAFIRFKAFYQGSGIVAPKVEGLNFSNNFSNSVKADHIGKVKQTFEMMGTALLILPQFMTVGLMLLSLSVPLAYESVRRKLVNRVMYVQATGNVVDYKTQRLWKQAKALGSHLIVGVPSGDETASTLLNVSASDSVDYVMTSAPKKISMEFLESIGVDFMVCLSTSTPIITKEVAIAQRCLVIGNDSVARPMEAKEQ